MAPKKGKAAKGKKKAKAAASEEKKIDPLAGQHLYEAVVEKAPYKILAFLVQQSGANVNWVHPTFRITPLMKAVCEGSFLHVEALLFFKANPNYRDAPTLKSDAEEEKGKGAKKAPPPKKGKDDKPVYVKERLPVVVPDPVLDGMTALHLSVHLGHTQITNMLVEQKDIDLNPLDKKMRTPLWIACAENRPLALKTLLQASAEMTRDPSGRTCFTIAAIRGNANIMKILLEYKPTCFEGNDDSQNVCYKSGENASSICGVPAKANRSVFDYLPSLRPAVLQVLMTLRHPYTPQELAHYAAKNGGLSCSIAAPATQHGNRMQDAEAADTKNTALMRAVIGHFTAEIETAADIATNVASLFMSGSASEIRKELQATNSSDQIVLHLCFGALPVKKYEEQLSHHNLGKLDPTTPTRRIQNQARDKGYLTAEFLWDQSRELSAMKNAEKKARERICLKIAHSLVDAAYTIYPEALDLKDSRGLTPLEYANYFGGIEFYNVFARTSVETVANYRPSSAVSSTRASTPMRPTFKKKSLEPEKLL